MLAPLIPPPIRRADYRVRPVKHDDRSVIDSVLWVLRTGTAWGLPRDVVCRSRDRETRRGHRRARHVLLLSED
ncbi:transposase [Noviherbaspirillum galbum]|uniref:transposase n=1 Tax=Noviherbaspirillum galbum TaxID=2709383 RepID=UPI0038B269CB